MEPIYRKNQDGSQEWRVNGKLHRTDGPAFIGVNGAQYWFLYGKRHRTDGPAVIKDDGYQAWWINDKLHRTDGPAVIFKNGYQKWYIDDKCITKQVNDWMEKHDVTWPWDEEIQVQFALIFC
jgi:hypothetical protein